MNMICRCLIFFSVFVQVVVTSDGSVIKKSNLSSDSKLIQMDYRFQNLLRSHDNRLKPDSGQRIIEFVKPGGPHAGTFALKESNIKDILKYINHFLSSEIFTSLRISRINSLRKSLENTSASSACINDTTRLINGTLSQQKWTVPFVDAAGKPGPSISLGWINFVGNYDQCEDAVAPRSPVDGRPGFKGEYCVFTISTTHPIKPKFSLCLPDTCSDSDIESITSEMFTRYEVNMTLESVECLKAQTKVRTATVLAIIILATIGILVILGTVYDLFYVQAWDFSAVKDAVSSEEANSLDNKSSKTYDTMLDNVTNPTANTSTTTNAICNILLAFSVYTNGKTILNVSQSSQSLRSTFGIRFLSMSWVVLGHAYGTAYSFSMNQATEVPAMVDRLSFDVIRNFYISVDSFFALGGLLTCYVTLNKMDKESWKINWPIFYFHRFWRLTPPYMIIIVISVGLTQYVGEGPLWSNQQPFDKNSCEDHWWRNLLYINNFNKFEDNCLGQSWYLANDMQFFLLSPLMIIQFHFHRVAGIVSCLVFLLASWITTGVLSTVNNWLPIDSNNPKNIEDNLEWFEEYYRKPWCRIGPYIVGIISGYILTKVKGKSLHLKWWVVALGWIVATASALAVVYGIHGDITGHHVSSKGAAALYNTVARSVWGAAVCWVIIACETGYGGPVNALLSWSPFVVLGRLSYMTYLIHMHIYQIFLQNMGSLFYANDTILPLFFIGLLTFSNSVAFIFMLGFESPMVGLEKVFLGHKRAK